MSSLRRQTKDDKSKPSSGSVPVSTSPSSSSSLSPSSQPPSQPSSPATPPPQQQLSEDILTVPNLLTMLRLALTPYIGYLVTTHQFVPAVTLLFFAAVTDLLDGWIARRTSRYTVFGSIADPAADKALVTTMVVSLALGGMLPWTMAGIILARDVALIISAFVIRYRTLAQPKTLKRYFNPRLPSATVTPTQISKYNTFLQLLLVGILTLYPILYPGQPSPQLFPDGFSNPTTITTTTTTTTSDAEQVDPSTSSSSSFSSQVQASWSTKQIIDASITALMWITAITTIWSGIGYLGGAGSSKSFKSGSLLQKVQNVSSKVSNTTARLKSSASRTPTKPPPPSPPPSSSS
ncbi:hypothetical protein BCV70DRAFT_200703 [Testicularia cyperi]|uniref:CDP-diacylglycerol--glycerol-3-phosphate 3-phosphatidyltransferase n=1 Tax=Testicularia cyperi TaxID=1882483 RepID=A0A317XN95_9BASI|nr:hypothetical protein BCV70DRAFT_200703 [Testicularia cyperi]